MNRARYGETERAQTKTPVAEATGVLCRKNRFRSIAAVDKSNPRSIGRVDHPPNDAAAVAPIKAGTTAIKAPSAAIEARASTKPTAAKPAAVKTTTMEATAAMKAAAMEAAAMTTTTMATAAVSTATSGSRTRRQSCRADRDCRDNSERKFAKHRRSPDELSGHAAIMSDTHTETWKLNASGTLQSD